MQKFFNFFVLALAFSLPVAAQTTVRVNCGGPSYSDSRGQAWQADFGFNGGSAGSVTGAVAGTSDPLLYENFRKNPTSYSFQVPNGQYQLNLYFDEANAKAERVSARVFDVSAQGTVVLSDLDIFASAGANAALIKSANVSVTNGTLTIGFTRVAGLDPEISAIEILPASNATTGPALTLNFTYPDGTAVSGTLSYTISSSLLSFQGSQALVNGAAQCQLFANPSSMGISTQFQVTLSLADTAGNILWQMTLGMNPAQVNLGGVQSSSLNVVVQKAT
ncbi:MAG: malectin domain-containing carbohydrate-binding protein [Candidatus Acidiferrum sp.]